MRFSKIKIHGETVELSYRTKDSAGTETEHAMGSAEAPAPEFGKALQAFVPLIVSLLELPEGYEEDLTVTTLSISETKDQRGLIVTALKKVEGAHSPFVIHTPLIRSKTQEGQPDGPGLISDAMQGALADAEKAADAFRTGARSQTELPLEPPVRPTAEGIEQIKKSARQPATVGAGK